MQVDTRLKLTSPPFVPTTSLQSQPLPQKKSPKKFREEKENIPQKKKEMMKFEEVKYVKKKEVKQEPLIVGMAIRTQPRNLQYVPKRPIETYFNKKDELK